VKQCSLVSRDENEMKFTTLRGCGEVGIEFSREDSEGARVSRDLLEKLIEQIVRRSVDYYSETLDYVFAYGERQLHSVVCPSIAAVTSTYLMEHPLQRKPSGEDEYSGQVDYWISFRNYSFLMEMKHVYFAYNKTDTPREDLLKKFSLAIDQLKTIRKEECEWLEGGDKKLFKIAFQVITFFSGLKSEISRKGPRNEELKLSFDLMMQNSGLADISNFRSLWILDKKLVEPFEYTNTTLIYPAVGFAGNVFE
jgi:hypothetical protein